MTELLRAWGAGDAHAGDAHAGDALERLAVLDPRKVRLVDLRYFAALGISEAATALGVSSATAGREGAVVRMWLRRELEA